MFTTEDIRKRLRDRPFVPVRIVTNTGQTYDVYHPDDALVMVGRRALIIGTASAEDPSAFEQVTRVALFHITELRDLPMPALQSGNGPT